MKALPTGIVGPTQVRTLTLKQLKDLIQDMYMQKQKYDEKCAESRLPRETMEQYMYTYLNQRYGLKNLIIEWAAAIINGVKRYSLEDSDVALFGKILRNECDEDFRFVHNEVKSAMADILRDKLKRKFKHKTEGEIAKLMTDIQAGEIEEWQWKEIIRKMYNEEHFAILEQRIRDKISERNPGINRADRRRLTREELIALQTQKERPTPFTDFQKVPFASHTLDCAGLPAGDAREIHKEVRDAFQEAGRGHERDTERGRVQAAGGHDARGRFRRRRGTAASDRRPLQQPADHLL